MISSFVKKFQRFISSRTNRIFIIPNRYGVYFLATLFTLFVISLSYGHSLAFTTTFIFSSLIAVSAHFTNYNIALIKLSSLQGTEVIAGENSTFEIVVKNESHKPRFDIQVSFSQSGESEVFSLGPYESRVVELKAVVSDRGAYNVEKMRVFTTFPFGLFYAWSFKNINSSFICKASQSTDDLILPETRGYADESGSQKEISFGGSEDFFGHINFLPGMPPKGMDWKAFARGKGKLYKKFVEFSGERLVIDLDEVAGTLDERVSKMAKLLELAENSGSSYSLTLEKFQSDFGRGADFKARCLDELALFKAPTRTMT